VTVAGVVVVHEPRPELERCLAALAPQVDELVVIANLPASCRFRRGRAVIRNQSPQGYAANANRGVAETAAPLVVVANPDTEPEPGAVAALTAFADEHAAAAIAGPQMRYPGRHVAAVAPPLPDRRRHARPPHAAPARRRPVQAPAAPLQPRRAARPSRSRPTGCSAGSSSCAATMLDELGGFDAASGSTARTSTSATAPRRRAGSAGTCPARSSRTATRVTDRRFLTRRTLWHWRGIARFVRKHPEQLLHR
jgi:hypothetical protein